MHLFFLLIRKTPIIAAMVLGSGCGSSSPTSETSDVVSTAPMPLSWVETAVVEEDIAHAIAASDYRLLAFSGRHTTLPGLDENEIETGQTICGIKYLQGTGDVVESEVQMLLRNKVYHYASRYNRAMLVLCIEAHQ